MNKLHAQKIFKKYNPKSMITRCPSELVSVRKELDTYARAAVNLYGVIPITELADIYNDLNSAQIKADDIFGLLINLVLRNNNPKYCFYKDNIVHHRMIEDFDLAETILSNQSNKSRYIPDKNEFLNFSNDEYEDKKQLEVWGNLLDYFNVTWPDRLNNYQTFCGIKHTILLDDDISVFGQIFEQLDLNFPNKSELQKFLNLIMEAKNNSRLFNNKGYTPFELFVINKKAHPNTEHSFIHTDEFEVDLNDSCPCGSGKRYKNCCYSIIIQKTAQLSTDDCQLFYETWYGLMGFINEKMKIINVTVKGVYPNPVDDEQIINIRTKLWENPELITEYLSSTSLPQEKVALLESWRDHHKRGYFVLFKYLPDYAVLIATDKNDNERLYGVKGVRRSLAEAIQEKLPMLVEVVLLPFKDKIVYDSFISSIYVTIHEDMLKAIFLSYNNAKKLPIITNLS
jgi:hypothetical protein